MDVLVLIDKLDDLVHNAKFFCPEQGAARYPEYAIFISAMISVL